MSCIFCKIINKEIPSFSFYEDDDVYAILDINPLVQGHCLLITKEHILDIRNTNLTFENSIKNVCDILEKKLNVNGFTVFTNTGVNQEIPHYHTHILPNLGNSSNLKFITQKTDKTPEEIYNLLIT